MVFGTKAYYQIGDVVNVTCKAGPSKPKATLSWLINGKAAASEYLSLDERQQNFSSNSNQLSNASLSLIFPAEKRYFSNGIMILTCNSVIRLEYTMSSELSLVSESKSSTAFVTAHDGEGTVITGIQSAYNVGDQINLTCTSKKAKPSAPELIWLINNEEATTDMLRHYSSVTTDDGSEKSSLGLQLSLNTAFVDIWSIRRKSRSLIAFKCKAKYNNVLMETSKDEIIRRFEPSTTKLHVSAENEVGA
ncbi:beat protein-like protein, partial [Dinothrombium tinctorium]